jgi:hypothetical protein
MAAANGPLRLNQVERWFALITTQAIWRGSFDSVADLKRKIDEFVKPYDTRTAATASTRPPVTELEMRGHWSRRGFPFGKPFRQPLEPLAPCLATRHAALL